jgi:hypothetical protein
VRVSIRVTFQSIDGFSWNSVWTGVRDSVADHGFDSRWGHWIFNGPNPSSRTMVLESTQPLTEMSTRNLPGGKGRTVRKADNITAICEPIVLKMWEPRRLTTLWAFMACYRDSFTFFLYEQHDTRWHFSFILLNILSKLTRTWRLWELVMSELH